MEKEEYSVGQQEPTPYEEGHNDVADIVHRKGHAVGEAADIYGDVQTAEQYGYVERGYVSCLCNLSSRLLEQSFETSIVYTRKGPWPGC